MRRCFGDTFSGDTFVVSRGRLGRSQVRCFLVLVCHFQSYMGFLSGRKMNEESISAQRFDHPFHFTDPEKKYGCGLLPFLS